jgi:hypothetical protein
MPILKLELTSRSEVMNISMNNPRIDEMLQYQKAINDRTDNRLGLLFQRRWTGQTRVKIAYSLYSGRECLFELDLESAFWYVCGMADSLGVSPLSKRL